MLDVEQDLPVLRDLSRAARANPNASAFVSRGQSWSYSRLADEATRLAQALIQRGVRRGDRVGIHMRNVPENVVLHYACFLAGAIAAPLKTRYKPAEIQRLLERLVPTLYIGEAVFCSGVAGILARILPPEACVVVGSAVGPSGWQTWRELTDGEADVSLPCRDPDAPATIHSTSGTTSEPKLVVHTLSTLGAIIEASLGFELESERNGLGLLTLHSLPGLSTLLGYVHLGVPLVLLERFDPELVLDTIEQYRCAWFPGDPLIFSELIRCQLARPRDMSSLRLCLFGGDVCSPELLRRFQNVFSVPLCSVWGATEVIGAFHHGSRPGPVHRLAPGAEVCLVNDHESVVTKGEVGELWLRGPTLAAGYWEGPGKVRSLVHDGWYRSGDLMRQGEGDEFWFVSRKTDMIIRDSINISPAEVEHVLVAHPAVRDAAVIGLPDPIFGQRVIAVVELADEHGPEVLASVRANAASQLADDSIPERFVVVERIPKNESGKTDRRAVRALVCGVGVAM